MDGENLRRYVPEMTKAWRRIPSAPEGQTLSPGARRGARPARPARQDAQAPRSTSSSGRWTACPTRSRSGSTWPLASSPGTSTTTSDPASSGRSSASPGEGWWARAARWYARRQRARDLERLADELVARFRSAGIFARAADDPRRAARGREPAPRGRARAPRAVGGLGPAARPRAVPPQPRRVRAGQGAAPPPQRVGESPGPSRPRVAAARGGRGRAPRRAAVRPPLRPTPPAGRSTSRKRCGAARWRAGSRNGRPCPRRRPSTTGCSCEGWARLSRFERAKDPALRLLAAYPGDGALAASGLSLLRSLSALAPDHADPARALVARTAPALFDPGPLWVELGELEEERGRPEAAREAWQHLIERDPRSPGEEPRAGHGALGLRPLPGGAGRAGGRAPSGSGRPEPSRLRGGRAARGAARRRRRRARVPGLGHSGRRRMFLLLVRERPARAPPPGRSSSGADRPRTGRPEQRSRRSRPGIAADERALVSLLPARRHRDARRELRLDGRRLDRRARPARAIPEGATRPARRAARTGGPERGRAWRRMALGPCAPRRLEMIPRATEAAFLDALEPWRPSLVERDAEAELDWQDAVLARRAELAPTPEERVAREVERARFLLEKRRLAEADAVWTALGRARGRAARGRPRLRAEAERAAYVERARGVRRGRARVGAARRRSTPGAWGCSRTGWPSCRRAGRGAEERQVLEASFLARGRDTARRFSSASRGRAWRPGPRHRPASVPGLSSPSRRSTRRAGSRRSASWAGCPSVKTRRSTPSPSPRSSRRRSIPRGAPMSTPSWRGRPTRRTRTRWRPPFGSRP